LRSIELRDRERRGKTGNSERNGRDVFAMYAMEEQATAFNAEGAEVARRGAGEDWQRQRSLRCG
jgi:methionine synthase I (cobalamin-dependent)